MQNVIVQTTSVESFDTEGIAPGHLSILIEIGVSFELM